MVAVILTNGKFRATDNDGNPLSGGKLNTYVAGTSTPKSSYSDALNYTPNANPVILNSRGEASVFLDGTYKLVLTDSDDTTIYTEDYVRLGQMKDINEQTDDYTLVISDAFKIIEMNKATAVNITVPPNVDVAYPIGTEIDLVQMGSGQVTVVAGAGVTIRTSTVLELLDQYSRGKLYKRATNEWVLTGELDAS